MKSEFKVGNRVVYHSEVFEADLKARVRKIDSPNCILIEFDEPQDFAHSASGLVDEQCGWWVGPDDIKLQKRGRPKKTKEPLLDDLFARIKALPDDERDELLGTLNELESKLIPKQEYYSFQGGKKITTEFDGPLFIRQGLATSEEWKFKEIGFEPSFTPILVRKDGTEQVLSDKEFLRFQCK